MEYLQLYLLVAFAAPFVAGFPALHTSTSSGIRQPSTYVAAVVEFTVSNTVPANITLATAREKMMSNLVGFDISVNLAKRNDAQIIVFPEYGIIGGGFHSRQQVLLFTEEIPDISRSQEAINPCIDGSFQDRPVLKHLSCLARQYEIALVANMGDKQPCTSTENSCPETEWYQYNTNVAFDKDGTLLAKYHKIHLFGVEKSWFDAGNSSTCASFTTSFGITFGMFTCFDILYPHPVDCLLEKDIQHYVFPTEWGSEYPYYMSIAVQQSWSWKHGVNLLASNIHNPHPTIAFYSTGSGLYSNGDAVKYYISGLDFPQVRGQAIIAELPRNPKTQDSHTQTGNRTDIGNIGAKGTHPKFVLLQRSSGNLTVSYTSTELGYTLHCEIDYEIDHSAANDTYAIGAYIEYYSDDPSYAYAVCTLCKCATNATESCGQPVKDFETSTTFKVVRLSGNFPQHKETLPILLEKGLKLVDLSLVHKAGEGTYEVEGLQEPLLAFSLWSGIYEQ